VYAVAQTGNLTCDNMLRRAPFAAGKDALLLHPAFADTDNSTELRMEPKSPGLASFVLLARRAA
jgi:hypothetical protein